MEQGTNIGMTFQMTLDAFLEEKHPVKSINQTSYEKALKKLEECKLYRSPQTKSELAEVAIQICPDCIEGYMTLGVYAQNIYDKIKFYKEGMELATMNLGKDFFIHEKADFYDFEEAKTLFHIKYAYACTLFEAGYMRKAQKQFQEILKLNPSDHFSVHNYLYSIYLYFEELEQCKPLLERYEQEDTFYVYTKFLFHMKGSQLREAIAMIPELKASNPYLYDLITYKAINTASLQRINIAGSEEEAGQVFHILSKVTQTMEHLHIFIVKNEEESNMTNNA